MVVGFTDSCYWPLKHRTSQKLCTCIQTPKQDLTSEPFLYVSCGGPILWRSFHNQPAQMRWKLKGRLSGFRSDVIHTAVLNAGSCRQRAAWNESCWSQTESSRAKEGQLGPWHRMRSQRGLRWLHWRPVKSREILAGSFTEQQGAIQDDTYDIFPHFHLSRFPVQ